MENITITQHKIYVENSKSGEKPRPLSQDNQRKIFTMRKIITTTLSEINFLSPKPQIHNPEKYPLTKQTRNTHIEAPNAPSI